MTKSWFCSFTRTVDLRPSKKRWKRRSMRMIVSGDEKRKYHRAYAIRSKDWLYAHAYTIYGRWRTRLSSFRHVHDLTTMTYCTLVLYCIYRHSSRLPEDWSKYTYFRNFCNTEFQRKKKQYFHKINEKLDEELDGSHRWWRKAKKIASIRKAGTCAGVPSLEENGIIANKPAEKSDMLANFFARQCSTPTPDSNDAVGCPYPLPKNNPVFEFPPISEHAVLKQLLKLSPFKSSGCRILTNRVLREIAPFIASSLACLYNLYIQFCSLSWWVEDGNCNSCLQKPREIRRSN